jgi:hypothetical protein
MMRESANPCNFFSILTENIPGEFPTQNKAREDTPSAVSAMDMRDDSVRLSC